MQPQQGCRQASAAGAPSTLPSHEFMAPRLPACKLMDKWFLLQVTEKVVQQLNAHEVLQLADFFAARLEDW